ncbi:hypothetical protein EDD85DRAFT_938554 [Armillaria nabsnona]|nr:hypothetical protein EDD85DRAFT_938554 [Armillaria nabsnona]
MGHEPESGGLVHIARLASMIRRELRLDRLAIFHQSALLEQANPQLCVLPVDWSIIVDDPPNVEEVGFAFRLGGSWSRILSQIAFDMVQSGQSFREIWFTASIYSAVDGSVYQEGARHFHGQVFIKEKKGDLRDINNRFRKAARTPWSLKSIFSRIHDDLDVIFNSDNAVESRAWDYIAFASYSAVSPDLSPSKYKRLSNNLEERLTTPDGLGWEDEEKVARSSCGKTSSARTEQRHEKRQVDRPETPVHEASREYRISYGTGHKSNGQVEICAWYNANPYDCAATPSTASELDNVMKAISDKASSGLELDGWRGYVESSQSQATGWEVDLGGVIIIAASDIGSSLHIFDGLPYYYRSSSPYLPLAVTTAKHQRFHSLPKGGYSWRLRVLTREELGHFRLKSTLLSSGLGARSVFDDKVWECHHYYGTEVHLASIEHAFCSVLETMQNLTFLSVSRFALNRSTVSPPSSPKTSMLLLEDHDDQEGFVQRYLGYRSGDYEETGHALYGASLGLAVVEEGDRRGVLIVKGEGGIEQFKITAAHTYPIPEDTYTLIDTRTFREKIPMGRAWVVGRSLPKGTFEKVSMLQMSGEEQRRLKDLGITEERRHILI